MSGPTFDDCEPMRGTFQELPDWEFNSADPVIEEMFTGLFQQQDDNWSPTLIFRQESQPFQDRSGAECGVCGHRFGRLYESGCPTCGHRCVHP